MSGDDYLYQVELQFLEKFSSVKGDNAPAFARTRSAISSNQNGRSHISKTIINSPNLPVWEKHLLY